MYNEKPSLKHLQIFGSHGYAHVPKEKRDKLAMNEEKCIFLGYSTQQKGYIVQLSEDEKIVTSRDVKFLGIEESDKTIAANLEQTTKKHEREGIVLSF